MFFDGNMAAPPTITVFSPDNSLFIIFFSCALTGATSVAVRARALNAAADSSAIRLDIDRLPMDGGSRRWPPTVKQQRRQLFASSLPELRERFAAVSDDIF